MKIRHTTSFWLSTIASALFVCFLCFSSKAFTVLLEFGEIDRETVDREVPGLASQYSNARFFATGFDDVSGVWRIIRIENHTVCREEYCPTVVAHRNNEWKILLLAEKSAELIRGDELVQITMRSTGGRNVILRYSMGQHLIYIP